MSIFKLVLNKYSFKKLCKIFKLDYYFNFKKTFYSSTSLQVLVGGEECKVESVDDEKIICRSPSKPASSNETLHMGGRGVLIEELTSESAMYNDTDSPGFKRKIFMAIA